MRSVLIVGGGIGGVTTAAALRAGGFEGEIALIDPAPLPYDRPPLSKDYLAGERDLKQIVLQPTEWYAAQRIDLRNHTHALQIDLGEQGPRVLTNAGEWLAGDRIVLATGGDASMPPVPGLEQVREAGRLHVLRDADDADALRAALQEGVRLLVVGGGLIGAEVASTAVRLGCEVTLVDPLDPPLPAAGEIAARWLHDEHARHQVATAQATVASFEMGDFAVGDPEVGDAVVKAHLDNGSTRQVDHVLLGVGMTPRISLATAAGLETERGVLVDEGQVTSHPAVLAVGDAAQRRGSRPAEHWEAAQLDGQRAAATILAAPAPTAGAAWWWSDRHSAHVEGVGSMNESGDDYSVVVRGNRDEAPFAVFTLRADRMVGAVAVDDSQSVRAARRLIDRGVRVTPEHLADPDTDLRKLLRG